MNKPHKHAELIKAWADGAEIEFRGGLDEWHVTYHPDWFDDVEYRLKPQPERVLIYLYVNPEREYAPDTTPPENGVWPISDKWKHVKTFEYTEGEE